MADSLEHILACQICLEDFEEAGDHVPRILPCSHTLCEKCLKQLIQGNFVECPECRKKHRVVNEVKTFPQNKYILANIRRKQVEIQKDQTSKAVDICEKHGKELILYCKAPDCLTTICQTCLTRHHRGHDVVETEEIEKEALLEKIEVVIKDLQERKRNTSEADNKNRECVEKIIARKEQLIQIINERCDQLLTQVREQIQPNEASAKEMIFDELLDLLNNIRDNVDKEVITHDEIEADMDTVTSIEESVQDHSPEKPVCNFFEFQINESVPADIERLCGHLEEGGEIKLSLARKYFSSGCKGIKVITSFKVKVLLMSMSIS